MRQPAAFRSQRFEHRAKSIANEASNRSATSWPAKRPDWNGWNLVERRGRHGHQIEHAFGPGDLSRLLETKHAPESPLKRGT